MDMGDAAAPSADAGMEGMDMGADAGAVAPAEACSSTKSKRHGPGGDEAAPVQVPGTAMPSGMPMAGGSAGMEGMDMGDVNRY